MKQLTTWQQISLLYSLNMNETKKSEKSRQAISMLVFSVLFMAVIAVVFTQDMNSVKAFITRHGVLGPILSILIYAALGMTFIPSEPLTLFIGALFGPITATLVAGIGNTLAGIVEYYMGKNISVATNFMEKKEKLPLGLGKLKVDSVAFLIGARMIPGYGPKVVSILGGVYHVPILKYIWTTAIPVFLGAAIFAYGGFGLGGLSGLIKTGK